MGSNDLYWFANDRHHTYYKWEWLSKFDQFYIFQNANEWKIVFGNTERSYYSYYASREQAEETLDNLMRELSARMQKTNDRLEIIEKKLLDVEKKTETLWVAPNMPGSIEAQEHFEEWSMQNKHV